MPFLSNFGLSIWVPGFDSIPQLPGGGPFVNAVTGGYFEAVGTPILRGTPITEEHEAAGERVAVVSRTIAATLWPHQDPLGRCVRVGRADAACHVVVGVAADVHRQGYREPPSMQFYVPIGTQDGFSGTVLVARPRRDAAGTARAIADALRDVHPVVDHVDVRRLDALLEPQIRPWRAGASVLSLTAMVAAVVSLLGVYGVLSYIVARRRREIGVRIALGASTAEIRRGVLRRGLVWAGVGVAAGLALVLTGARWLGPLLFKTSAADPFVLGAVCALLVGASVLACVLPAAHAARVDALASLRGEA